MDSHKYDGIYGLCRGYLTQKLQHLKRVLDPINPDFGKIPYEDLKQILIESTMPSWFYYPYVYFHAQLHLTIA